MDSEALKRRIAQELQDQFEGKLREARREKTEVEEELESASERWRAERRRLNSEIDRLEAALTEVKATKKPTEVKEDPGDVVAEWASQLATAEERMAAANEEWETERRRLESEVERLENSVTEILERSNNPVRSLHAIQQKLETQLQDAIGSKQRLESDFARAKASWEEERLKIAGEVFRLRRAGGATEPTETGNEALRLARTEIEQLRQQLEDAQKAQKAAKSTKSEAGDQALRLAQSEIEQLQQQLEDAQKAQKAAKSAKSEAGDQALRLAQSEIEQLRRELEDAHEAVKATQSAKSQSDNEALRRAEAEIEQLRQQLEDAGKAAKAAQSTKSHDTSSKVAELESKNHELNQELANVRASLEEAKKQQPGSSKELEQARAEIRGLESVMVELRQSVAEKINKGSKARYSSQIEELEREKASLAQKLEQSDALAQQEKQRAAGIAEELENMRAGMERLERSQTASRDTVRSEMAEALGAQYAAELDAVAKEKATLEGRLASADALIAQERQRAATAVEELRAAREEAEQLERQAGKRGGGGGKAVEKVRAEFGEKMEAITQENTHLTAQLENAAATLDQERQRFAALGEELTLAQSEIQKLESRLSEGGVPGAPGASETSQEEYVAQFRALEQEKASLVEQLERSNASLAQERNLAAAVTEELRRARHKSQRGGNRDSGQADAGQDHYMAQVEEIAREKEALSAQLQNANQLVEQERQRCEAVSEELRRSQMEHEQLEKRLSNSRDAVDSEVIEQLRQQYASKLEEIAEEKTELAGRLESASALLEQERQRFSTAAGGGPEESLNREALEQEVARVEGAIAEITKFIDDPSAQLAAVIRKNVERAELDAYLKGILFARGELSSA